MISQFDWEMQEAINAPVPAEVEAGNAELKRIAVRIQQEEQGYNGFYMGLDPDYSWSDCQVIGWLKAKVEHLQTADAAITSELQYQWRMAKNVDEAQWTPRQEELQ